MWNHDLYWCSHSTPASRVLLCLPCSTFCLHFHSKYCSSQHEPLILRSVLQYTWYSLTSTSLPLWQTKVLKVYNSFTLLFSPNWGYVGKIMLCLKSPTLLQCGHFVYLKYSWVHLLRLHSVLTLCPTTFLFEFIFPVSRTLVYFQKLKLHIKKCILRIQSFSFSLQPCHPCSFWRWPVFLFSGLFLVFSRKISRLMYVFFFFLAQKVYVLRSAFFPNWYIL